MADTAVGASVRSESRFDRSVVLVLGNAGITGVLGSLFWLLAPRAVDDSTVAASVAASSLLITLGVVAQLNLATSLSRFLPGAGAGQRSLVSASYRAAVGAACVIAVLVVGVGLARGGSVVSGGDLGLTMALAVSLPVWTVFALQDGALVATRRAVWLPIENGITSLGKLALLPAAAALSWRAGLLVAWTLPIIPAVLIVNQALYSRILDRGRATHPEIRRAVRYGLSDLPGIVVTIASLRLVPLIVVETQDASTGAHIGVPWSIIAVSALALPALSRLALSEMAHTPERASALLRELTRFVLVLLVPAALLAAGLAPVVLRLAGKAYADEGSLVLALGVLGLLPAALVEMRLAALRFEHRMALASVIQMVRAALVLTGVLAATLLGHVAWIGAAFAGANLLALATADVLLARGAASEVFVRSPVASRRAGAVRLLPGAVGVVLAALATRRVRVADLGDLGLIGVLPIAWFAGVLLLVVGFVVCLGGGRARRIAAAMHVGALVVFLHGLPGMVERHPRFPVAWLHVGFADRIATEGDLLPLLDARFSWAGFFAGAGFLQRLTGDDSLLWLVRFAPVVVVSLAALAISVIGRLTGGTRAQAVAGAGLFVLANWIGQDYFAPQAVGFLLYLVVIALVLGVFGADPAVDRRSRIRNLLRPEHVVVPPADERTRRLAYLAIVVMSAALVISHQLTPVFLLVTLLLLAVTRCTGLRGLPFVVAAMYVGWLGFAAEAYWLGHLDNIVGSVGKVSSLLGQNVGERSRSTSVAREIVVRSRMGFALGVWAVAAVAAIRAWRRGRLPVALVCMLVAPFPLLAAQPYGGEMILRATLFTLPASCLLAARAVVPANGVLGVRRRVVVAAALAVVVPVFLLARFGNERFEYVSDDDAALAQAVVELVPPDSLVYVRSRQTLVNADRVGDVRYRDFGGLVAEDVIDLLDGHTEPVFVMLSESQAAYGEVSQGRPEGWMNQLQSELFATGRLAEVARFGDAVLYRLLPTTDPTGANG